MLKKIACLFLITTWIPVFAGMTVSFSPALAQTEFNPHFIISDEEMQTLANWTRDDVQKFLDGKGSYLRAFSTEDVSGAVKPAADIIYDAARAYTINPKYLLVTLQKEQSLITDDAPSQKQLDWATGYAVCDSCDRGDPAVAKHKGFGKQVDDAAGIIRWYYDNRDRGIVKKKDQAVSIDNQSVIPQSWATAFLYTYTPHLHGNKNFWKIWQTWFAQNYPNGTLLVGETTGDTYLIQNNTKRKFKNKSTLLSRADPEMIITVPESELSNYATGPEISFPNFSLLRSPASAYYLLDYDTIRPFAGEEVIRYHGYNPQEIIDVSEADLTGLTLGTTIYATSTPVQGVVYQITDLKNALYMLKDGTLYPIIDKKMVEANYKNLKLEKKKLTDIKNYPVANQPLQFKDGTLIRIKDSETIYVIENGKKRRLADEDTFLAMGYKYANVISVELLTALNIFDGEPIFINGSLLSAKDKFLGDNQQAVIDNYGAKLPSYLVAEYPSGRILSGKNIDARRPIASLTKAMVAYEAIYENLAPAKITAYSAKKYRSEGYALKVRDGAKFKNADLLSAALIGSYNNIAKAVVGATGLDEDAFLAALNRRLSDWGADNTKIADLTGLDEKNFSTARDLLRVYTKVLKNETIAKSLGTKKFILRNVSGKSYGSLKYTVQNRNKLFFQNNKNYKIIASKTGYTDEAGAVLFMVIESKKTKKKYTIITLGDKNYNYRFKEPDKIASWISSDNANLASN
ncbi:D-alanyl-D-alanine carboxypeptidase [Patescibacteria group bacterium]|nr:MAG: D-alanyl-D-alanine carboxypeptidase [Patescibacteria group bacterium]